MPRYSCRKRHFLNSILTDHTSYIAVLCESSCDGDNANGLYMITIADCRRIVELDFSLHSAKYRKQSLHKIDRLIDTLGAFRVALHKEAELISKKHNR